MTENYRDGANPADALARVERGERVEITRNGSRVAILVPAQPDPLSGLIESGDFRPAQGALPMGSETAASASDSAGN